MNAAALDKFCSLDDHDIMHAIKRWSLHPDKALSLEVYHLKGGILKYLEDVPAEQSMWQGECYVFDGRVSVGHGLVPGQNSSCGACRRPVTPEGRAHADYEEGVCCAACADEYSPADRARFRERQRQMQLAAARGERHLGQAPD